MISVNQSAASASSSNPTHFQPKMKPADVHLMLARAIQRRKTVLFAAPGRGNNVTQQNKEEEWESLRKEMVANGVTRFERKTWQTVRDVDFQQIRRKAIHRQNLANQQGGVYVEETEVNILLNRFFKTDFSSSIHLVTTNLQFDSIMMDVLSYNTSNQGENRFTFDFKDLKMSPHSASPMGGNESERYTESPPAFDSSSQAMATLLTLMNQGNMDMLTQVC